MSERVTLSSWRKALTYVVAAAVALQPVGAMAAPFAYRQPLSEQAAPERTAPVLQMYPAELDLGTVQVAKAASRSISLYNNGNSSVSLEGLTTSSEAFVITDTTCANFLPAKGHCDIEVSFQPATSGSHAASLMVSASAGSRTLQVPLSGFALAGELVASPNTITFGQPTQQGEESAEHIPVQVTNVGSAPVQGISVSRRFGAAFSQTNNCSRLEAGGSCEVIFSFQPASSGQHAGEFIIDSDAVNGAVEISLYGTAVAPAASLSVTEFASTRVGQLSTAVATLTNTGVGPLSVVTPTTASVSGADFRFRDTACETVLAAGQSCSTTIEFAPTTLGLKEGVFTVETSAGERSVALAALATQVAIAAAPVELSFPDTVVGQSTLSGTVTVTNTGNLPVPSLAVALPDEFSLASSTCDEPIAVGTSCTFRLRFSPHQPRSVEESVRLQADGAQALVYVRANAVQGVLQAVDTLEFEAQIGQTQAKTFEMRNIGDGPLTVSSLDVAPAGDAFSVSHNCETALAPGAGCEVTVAMTPTELEHEAVMVVHHDGRDGQTSIQLSGVGRKPMGALSVPPFGELASGTHRDVVATLSNTGIGPLTFTVPAPDSVTGEGFTFVSTTCTGTLNVGQDCDIVIRLTASGSRTHSGMLAVDSSAGLLHVTLTGVSLQSRLLVVANTAGSMSADKGGAPASGVVTLRNEGNIAAEVTFSGLSAPYSFTPSSCTLAPGATCDVSVSMSTGGAVGSQPSQTLTATGASAGAVTAQVSGVLNGSIIVVTSTTAAAITAHQGGAPGTGTVSYRNDGNKAATITFSGLSAPYSVSPASCTLAAGASCTVTVSMATSGTPGQQPARTLVASGGSNGSVSTTVQGTLIAASANLTNVAFGARTAGTSVQMAATLTNTGGAALSVATPTAASVSGNGFSFVSTTCGGSLAPSASCTVTVRFTPSGNASYTGQLTVNAGAAGTKTATLTGTSQAPALSFSPSSIAAFGQKDVGSSTDSTLITLTNNGNLAATGLNITLPAGFTRVNATTCGTTLAAKASCSFYVRFSPTAVQTYSGSVTATTTAGGGSSASLSVSGSGKAPSVTITPGRTNWGQVGQNSDSGDLFTVRNNSSVSVVITSHTVASGTGWASQGGSSQCQVGSTVLAPGASCRLFVGIGSSTAASGNYSVTSRVGYRPQSVTTAFSVDQTFTYSLATTTSNATSRTFGNVNIGSTSSAQTFVLTNNAANSPVSLSISMVGSHASLFPMSHNCGSTLAAGASCTVTVYFSPTSVGTGFSATVRVARTYPRMTAAGAEGYYYSAGNLDLAVSGNGVGAVPTPTTSLNVNLGHVSSFFVGTPSLAQITFRNNGNANMTLTMSGLSKHFVSNSTCNNVAPGATCAFALGIRSGAPDNTLLQSSFTISGPGYSVNGSVQGSYYRDYGV